MTTDNPESLANRLRRRRTELAIEQGPAAEMIGVTERQYRRWEKGEALVPRVSYRARLADFLQIDHDELLALIGETSARSFNEDREETFRLFEEFLRQRGRR